MPHQCTKCGIIFPDASQELLTGCSCGSRFFYYIKQERLDSLEKERETQEKIKQLNKADKIQIEKDIREITGMEDEPEKPVILDLESVKVLEPGKFEIDIINLFSKKRPLIYKLEEGKYIIDLSSSFKRTQEVDRKIRNPDLVLDREEKIKKIKSKDENKDENIKKDFNEDIMQDFENEDSFESEENYENGDEEELKE